MPATWNILDFCVPSEKYLDGIFPISTAVYLQVCKVYVL